MDLHSLLGGGARAAQEWLDRVVEDREDPLPDFAWHSFAEGAAHNARFADNVADADAWAVIAVAVYRRLAAKSGDGFTFELSAMNLKAWMMSTHGHSAGHPVRDYGSLVSWFVAGTAPMVFEDADRAARNLRQLPIDRWSEQIDLVRTLRQIKNRLNVFRGMKAPTPPPEIQRWLTIWDRLP